jgi:hypothetical protein
MIIGLTGKRNVGKSTVADLLVANHGFVKAHTFESGKHVSRAYFEYCGATADESVRMTDGDLKDKPSPYLPHMATPRYFMEKLGRFMGVGLGVEYTFGATLKNLMRKYPDGQNFVFESVVYESDFARKSGAIIVMVQRDLDPSQTIDGIETDKALEGVLSDFYFSNRSLVSDLPMKVADLYRRLLEYTCIEEPSTSGSDAGDLI